MTDTDDVITVSEAAPIIGRSVQGTYRAVRAGHIPAGIFFRIGRDLYFRRAALLAWRNAGGTAATTPSQNTED
jgi:hypothetical protein